MSCLCQKCKKELGVTEKYPDFEKLPHVIQHGLQGFIVKNIELESKETNDLSHTS